MRDTEREIAERYVERNCTLMQPFKTKQNKTGNTTTAIATTTTTVTKIMYPNTPEVDCLLGVVR